MDRHIKHYVFSAVVLAGTGFVSPAVAQDDTGFSIEEVTVTARRIEESLQDTPIAVTVVTGEKLLQMGVEQITAVGDIAPNVNFSFAGTTSGSDSAAVIFIRGIGQNDFTLVTDPGVGLYVDGVYYSRTIGSVLDVFELERIEVLRGPQGTLFGRNSTGGAISLTTVDPGDEFGGNARLLIGDEGRREFNGILNVPISENFAFNISGLARQCDGSATDASGRELGDDDMVGGRIKGVWTPSEDFRITFAGDFVSENEGSAAEVPLIRAPDGSVDSSTVPDFTPVLAAQGESVNDQSAGGVSVTVDWAFNESMSLRSITA